MSTSRENILSKIRTGKEKTNLWKGVSEPKEDSFYSRKDGDLIDTFKNSLITIDGEFKIANNPDELDLIIKRLFSTDKPICFDKTLQTLLTLNSIEYSSSINTENNPTGFIVCENLIARLGSVLTSSAINSGRQANIFPEHQIVFAKKEQLVYDIEDAIKDLKTRYSPLPSMISFATGPSRTADIEKTLILGAHGPKMLTIIFQNFD